MKIGQKVKGTVVGIKSYGAFVRLEDDSVGLLHISEIKPGYVDNIHRMLTIGQEIVSQIIDIDEYSQKASLSLRTLEKEKHHLPQRHRFSSNRYKTGFKPLEKELPLWVEEGLDFLKSHSK